MSRISLPCMAYQLNLIVREIFKEWIIISIFQQSLLKLLVTSIHQLILWGY